MEIFKIPDLQVIKTSFPRSVAAGSFDDSDQHGGQQYVPLAGLPVPTRPDPLMAPGQVAS